MPSNERQRPREPLMCSRSSEIGRAMTPAKEHRQPSEESKREELALVRAESDACSRFTRLKVAFDDKAVIEAAKTLWSEASAAVRDHQAKMNCSR